MCICCKSENPASLDDNKFDFVYEASRRSNAVCLRLFTKELEASPGESAASSIISRHLNDSGSTNNSQVHSLFSLWFFKQYFMYTSSFLKYVRFLQFPRCYAILDLLFCLFITALINTMEL